VKIAIPAVQLAYESRSEMHATLRRRALHASLALSFMSDITQSPISVWAGTTGRYSMSANIARNAHHAETAAGLGGSLRREGEIASR
jgi:hypothetical protein